MDSLTRATQGFGMAGVLAGVVLFVIGGLLLSRAMLDRMAFPPTTQRRGKAPAPSLLPGGVMMILGTVLFFLGTGRPVGRSPGGTAGLARKGGRDHRRKDRSWSVK